MWCTMPVRVTPRATPGALKQLRYTSTDAKRVLEHGHLGSTLATTYPNNSDIVNPRHFYQTAVSEWASKAARPVSLRQLAFFSRSLTEEKIFMSANYVSEELPIRLSHLLIEMQDMPYRILSNPLLVKTYEQHIRAFELFRKIGKINTFEDNDKFCKTLEEMLRTHNSMLPDLMIGVMEVVSDGFVDDPKEVDDFVVHMLRSRISRRLIGEQHRSLSESFRAGKLRNDRPRDYISEVILSCNVGDVIRECFKDIRGIFQHDFPQEAIPELRLEGDTDITFPYVLSHLEYIVSEILRNSTQALVSRWQKENKPAEPIVVSVSSSSENIYIRVSEQGGGISPNVLGTLWSFAKPLSGDRDHSQDAELRDNLHAKLFSTPLYGSTSLRALMQRSTNIRMGMGLALAKVYTEYWDGTLELHSLEGYGSDTLLRLSRLGTRLENLTVNGL